MAIFGIGNDMVQISRIAKVYKRYPESLIKRILHPKEQIEITTIKDKVRYLAKHFAAKEAITKAIGTGFRNGITFHDMLILHTELGQPYVELSGVTYQLFKKNNIIATHLSLSDEREYCVAMVIVEV